MKKLIYHVAVSVDGFIARKDGSWDFFLQEGEHVTDYVESFATYDTVLMGRSTYKVGLDLGVTNPYPMMKAYVFSRSMTESPDPNVTLVSENAAEVVRGLKNEDGKDIYLCGGADLAAQLISEGLVDEVLVKLNPVLAGSGISMFGDLAQPVKLTLADSKIYDNGVLLLRYRVVR